MILPSIDCVRLSFYRVNTFFDRPRTNLTARGPSPDFRECPRAIFWSAARQKIGQLSADGSFECLSGSDYEIKGLKARWKTAWCKRYNLERRSSVNVRARRY